VLDHALETARRLGTLIPPDTFRLTKSQLRLDTIERIARDWPAERAEVTRLWSARVADGWIRGYMERVTKRSA